MKVDIGILRNRYRLRFTVNKKTYCISTGLETGKASLIVCQQVKSQIELDAITGNLDLTLEKYRAMINPSRNAPEPVQKPLEATEKDKRVRSYKTSRKAHRTPLDTEQIRELLQAVKECRFDSDHSAYPSSHYYPLIFTAFKTGMRNQELEGLQVKYVDLQKRLIEVSSVLARTKKGSHHAARVRKGTKNGKTRFINITDDLLPILQEQCKGKSPDDLVFTGFRGGIVDTRMLQRRVIKPYLENLGFPDKDFYMLRHHYQSVLLQTSDLSLNEISYLSGNEIATQLKFYQHLIGKVDPSKIPNF